MEDKKKRLNQHSRQHDHVYHRGVLCASVCRCAHLSRLGVGPLLEDVGGEDGNVPPLLVQDHGELPVELFDLQVDPVLALKHLTDLPVTHALVQVLD